MPSWPLARLTTYVASSTPVIKAADLNSMQDSTIDLFAGNKSVASLDADGTGAAASAASAGDVRAKHYIAKGTAPTPTAGGAIGSTGAVGLTGKDCSHVVSATPGGTGIATSGAVVLVAYNVSFGSTVPRVEIAPGNAYTATVDAYISATANTGYTISVSSTPRTGSNLIVSGNQMIWNVHVIAHE